MKRKADSAFFLNKIIGIVLALFGFVLFGFAFFKLYEVNLNQESKNAQKTFDLLMTKLNTLQEGQSTAVTLQGFKNADKWYFIGWSAEIGVDQKPNKCFFGEANRESCLCVCPGTTFGECQEKGFCRDINFENVAVYGDTNLSQLVQLEPGKRIVLSTETNILPYIRLSKQLFEITVSKQKNILTLVDTDSDVIRTEIKVPFSSSKPQP